MLTKKETSVARRVPRDPFAMLREMSSELDRVFDAGAWPTFRWPLLRTKPLTESAMFMPAIDVFVKDNRLFTRVDLPGLKKEDVKVELVEGQLTISGERKHEVEEKKEDFYRSEREYGSFCRVIPLPEGVKLDDVKATFAEGVLEVTVPLPAQTKPEARTVAIQDAPKTGKAA